MNDLRERRRLSFGSVAEQYDRARPTYPEQLVDDAIAYAGDPLTAAGRALEVGPGTGKATLLFAARGLQIDAIEPDAAMAEVASRRLAAAGFDVHLQVSDFESADIVEDVYGLLYSGQAWHWVTPERRYELAARALSPGGALAVFWNRPDWSRCELREAVDAAYVRSQARLGSGGPMRPGEHPSDGEERDWREQLVHSPVFTDAEVRRYDWVQRYDAAEYVDLLGTQSDHLLLEADERERLFAEIMDVIEAVGGSFELPYGTLLCLARRRP